LTPEIKAIPGAAVKVTGSVTVRTMVPPSTTAPTYVHIETATWIDSARLTGAIEQAIRNDAAFSQVRADGGDYLLEVWVDKVQNVLDISGEGFVFDLTSVWRLTRQRDGKVIACEFVRGHAGAHAVGAKAYPIAIGNAARDMVVKGLAAVTDTADSHLSALSVAEKRPAIPASK
jgi:hypothetical protein